MSPNPSLVTSGPGFLINGPVPQKPDYTLIDATTLVAEASDRWMNGLSVRPYPPDLPVAYDACNPPSDGKASGAVIPHPDFSAYTILLAETCTAQLGSQAEFAARAEVSLNAVTAYAVEYEFYSGAVMTNSPSLVSKIDDTGTVFTGGGTDITTFPAANVAQKPQDALAYLENEIAKTGKAGVIHCTPGMLVALTGKYQVKQQGKLLLTANGTILVPGYGYVAAQVDGYYPVSGDAATPPKQEWMIATGLIEVRQSEIFLNPEELSMAMDRSTNTVTYRAERYVAVDWDTTMKSAVKADWSL